MGIIVAACVSQFHGSDDEFELLLAYDDGREIGHTMTRSAARQMASECAYAIGDVAPERRTVAGQQSGVSTVEAIEKAMEGVTHPDAPEWIAVAQDGDGPNGGFWTCAAATTESPRYIRADIYAALARNAEALQRENAELREALKRISELTPAHANARDAKDLHLTVKAIADVALAATRSGSATSANGGCDDG